MLRSTWGTSPILRAFFARDERGLERDEVLGVAGRRAAGGSLRRGGCVLTATVRGNRSLLDEGLPYLTYTTSQVPIPQVMTPVTLSSFWCNKIPRAQSSRGSSRRRLLSE